MFLFIFLIILNIFSCKSMINPKNYQDNLKISQKHSKIYINKAREEIIQFHHDSSNKKYTHLKKSIDFLEKGVKDVLSYEEKKDFRSFFKKIEKIWYKMAIYYPMYKLRPLKKNLHNIKILLNF